MAEVGGLEGLRWSLATIDHLRNCDSIVIGRSSIGGGGGSPKNSGGTKMVMVVSKIEVVSGGGKAPTTELMVRVKWMVVVKLHHMVTP